jgi:hypothetical protein
MLVVLPAAAQLPPAAVFDILKQLVQLLEKPCGEWQVTKAVSHSCCELLKMPQAKEIPAADVRQLLDAAWGGRAGHCSWARPAGTAAGNWA